MYNTYFVCKRSLDIFGSMVLIILFSPILLIVSLCVKLTSKGGVLFKQQRIGLNGIPFTIYKFRSMIVGAEKTGTGLNSYENDPRVTKLGKFLRDSSLDELPQLLNIVKGDMSFVGPRPPVTYSPYYYKDYSFKNKQRFTVKPGVTGWAQVNGRNELSWDEKFVYDIEYVKNMSVARDFYILLLTVKKVMKNEGSYDKK